MFVHLAVHLNVLSQLLVSLVTISVRLFPSALQHIHFLSFALLKLTDSPSLLLFESLELILEVLRQIRHFLSMPALFLTEIGLKDGDVLLESINLIPQNLLIIP